MSSIQEKLAKLQERITSSKNEISILKGRKQELMKSLKEVSGVQTIEESKDKLKKMEREMFKLAKEIEKEYNEIEMELET